MIDRYKGKYFSVLGDSISTLEGYSEPKTATYYDGAHATDVHTFLDTWWGKVIWELQGQLLVNNSISGSTVCWDVAYTEPNYGCSDKRTSALHKGEVMPDVIMVFMGTNDFSFGLRVTSARDLKEDENKPSLFGKAYSKMLEKLRRNYPKAEIWCCTLPISCCSSKDGFQFPTHYAGRDIKEYCEAIRASAKRYGCRIIDLYNADKRHDTKEGFHPTASGMQTLAENICNALQREA